MIAEIVQTKHFKDMEWVFREKGNDIAIAQSPFEVGRFQILFHTGVEEGLRLYFNPSDTSYGRKLENRLSFHIFSGGDRVGYIVGRVKGRFLKGYSYFEMKYQDTLYQCYEIGMGTKGLYLCIYRGGSLVTTVKKDRTVVDFKDNYMLYLKSEEYFIITSLFTLYYDVTNYGDIMERKVHSSSTTIKFTKNKELLEKYDPLFIQKILESDENS